VAQKENERRIVEARTQREALIAEARGQVVAQVAEAKAQLSAWDARVEQVRRRLEADVVAPAIAEKARLEAEAKAQASMTLAHGKAGAAALASLAEAYRSNGESARDALLLQKLVPIFENLTSTMKKIKVDRLTVMGQPHGQPGGSSALVGSLLRASEQVRVATGIDLAAVLPAPRGDGAA
jgi:flotillin